MAARKSSRSRSSSAKSRSLGCLFWICLLAIIVAVGYAARGPISDTFTRLFGGKPAAAHQQEKSAPPTVTMAPIPTQQPAPPPAPASQPPGPAAKPGAPGVPDAKTTTVDTSVAAHPQTQAQQPEKPVIRKTRLFFLSVDQNGKILMKGVIRPIAQSDSPLRDALETLLKGPTSQEINLGLMTMVPTGTVLRGVSVRGDTAFIDFSESFRFNSLGIEAMTAQLRQVVYAATEFPTVKKVQILIEGKKVDYLGTEGVRIDQPLSRASFQN